MRTSVLLVIGALVMLATPAATVASVHGDGTSVRAAPGRQIAAKSACGDTAYAFLGPNAAWERTLAWSFRASSVPAGLNVADVLAVIKKSFRNVTNGRNDCGLADNISATHRYLGTTSVKPGVSSSGRCTGMDGRNVVGFGALGSYYSGYTCIWWDGDEIVEMDMRLDTDTPWALTMASCMNELMMEALVTHEVGHAYGLGHVGENRHGRQTMSVYIDGYCQNQEATLGRGDMLGLAALY